MCVRFCFANVLMLHQAEERLCELHTARRDALAFEFDRRRLDAVRVQQGRSGEAVFRMHEKYVMIAATTPHKANNIRQLSPW